VHPSMSICLNISFLSLSLCGTASTMMHGVVVMGAVSVLQGKIMVPTHLTLAALIDKVCRPF
jgi:hypothetical protein